MNEYIVNGFADELEKISSDKAKATDRILTALLGRPQIPSLATLAGGIAGYTSGKNIQEGEKEHKDRVAFARFLARNPALSLFLPGGAGYTMGRALSGENILKNPAKKEK